MQFRTEHSTYEVDHETKRFRRLSSDHPPSKRQGPDGEWKEFYSVGRIMHQMPVLILWDATGAGTVTSPVVWIEGDDDEPNDEGGEAATEE